jgi:hypothetical protein|tara:strand:+ start:41012 stop:41215 length:204 start_codon:yes stop_codon:yes gene_type:complete
VKLKQVKCTTQELQAVCNLLEKVNVGVKDGMWVYEMYKKFDKAFIEAAEADPEWIEAEEESIVVQDG